MYYNQDFSTIFNLFANLFVLIGAVTVLGLFYNISWFFAMQVFKVVDNFVNS